jgi:hypothetical protein
VSGRKRWTHLDQMVGEGLAGSPAGCSDEGMRDSEFIEWAAGPCPVSPDAQVSVYFVDGRHLTRSAGAFIKADTGEDYWKWQCHNDRDGIARYRVHAPRMTEAV